MPKGIEGMFFKDTDKYIAASLFQPELILDLVIKQLIKLFIHIQKNLLRSRRIRE